MYTYRIWSMHANIIIVSLSYRLYKIKIQQTSYKLAFLYSCTEFSHEVQFVVIISTEVLTCTVNTGSPYIYVCACFFSFSIYVLYVHVLNLNSIITAGFHLLHALHNSKPLGFLPRRVHQAT